MTGKVSFAERLREGLTLRKMQQKELSDRTGIPKSALSQYCKGSFVPKQQRTALIAEALDVNEAWLMGYDVPMERTIESLLHRNCVVRVKRICNRRGIPISKLESDLDFANGYIEQLENGVFPTDRLAKIANYLGVSTDYLMGISVDALADDAEYEFREVEKRWKEASDEEKEDLALEYDLKREALEDMRFAQEMKWLEISNSNRGEPSTAPISDRDIRAAFFNGYSDDLSEDEQDALWADAQAYMEFKLSQRKKKGE